MRKMFAVPLVFCVTGLLLMVEAIPAHAMMTYWDDGGVSTPTPNPRLNGLKSVDVTLPVGVYVPAGNLGLTNCAPMAGNSGTCTDQGFTIRVPAQGCIAVDRYSDGTSISGQCSIGAAGNPLQAGTGIVDVTFPPVLDPTAVGGCAKFSIAPTAGATANIEFVDGAGIAWTVDGLGWDAAGGAPAPGGKTDWPSNTVTLHAKSGQSNLMLNLSGDLNGYGSCTGGQSIQSSQFTLQGTGQVTTTA